MRIPDLVLRFDARRIFPVSPNDIAKEMTEAGIEEEISFLGVEMDPEICRGFVVQTTMTRQLYDSRGNGNHTKVFYSINQPADWQRLVCCKELLHLLDTARVRTATTTEVETLISKIVLAPQFSVADATDPENHQAIYDRFGAIQAVAVMFPLSVRDMLLPLQAQRKLNYSEIARIVGIPERYVRLVMSPHWMAIYQAVIHSRL